MYINIMLSYMKNRKSNIQLKVVLKSDKLELDPILLSGVRRKLKVQSGLDLSKILTSKKKVLVMAILNELNQQRRVKPNLYPPLPPSIPLSILLACKEICVNLVWHVYKFGLVDYFIENQVFYHSPFFFFFPFRLYSYISLYPLLLMANKKCHLYAFV